MTPDKPDASDAETGCGLTIKRGLNVDNKQQNDMINLPSEILKQNQSGSGSASGSSSSSSSSSGGGSGTGSCDDDLTSLTWLHQQNLLKGLELTSPSKKDENMNINNNISNHNNNSNYTTNILTTSSNNSNSNLCEDSADYSENTNSISSLDDNYYFPENNASKNDYQSPNNKNYEKTIQFFHDSPKGSYSGSQSNQTKISLNNINNNNNNNNNSSNDNNNNISNNNLPTTNRNKHPTHIPYDPHLHRNSKPPYSFSCLIFMAIEDSPVKALPVKEVYAWILDHFPYFRNAPTGWKNSVRHNLSLNKCFRKVEKAPNLGKGSLWMVDDQYRPNLLQALSRAPFPPPTGQSPNSSEKLSKKTNSTRLPDPVLFPYLSKRLASSNIADNSEIEFDSDVDAAAAAMLSFKHGPIIINHNKSPTENRKRKSSDPETLVPIITRSSSEDHTYSCITSIKSEGMKSVKSTIEETDVDVDEQRKIAEGADALLNLAGIALNHNNTSPNRYNQQMSTSTLLINHVKQPADIHGNSPKSKRRLTSNDYTTLPDKRRKRWKEWADSNRYLKQVRG